MDTIHMDFDWLFRMPAYKYIVKNGDNMHLIAHMFHTTVLIIAGYNHMEDADMVVPGMTLFVPVNPPQSELYVVKPGDTLGSIAWRYGMHPLQLSAFNYLLPPYILYPGQLLVVWHPTK